jgi:hypothetical protein
MKHILLLDVTLVISGFWMKKYYKTYLKVIGRDNDVAVLPWEDNST